MKKKSILLYALTMTSIMLQSSITTAESIDTKGSCYFHANGDLAVVNTATGNEVARYGEIDGISGATDVSVENGKAVITEYVDNTEEISVVDVSGLTECNMPASDSSSERYLATYENINNVGMLYIPGVKVDGRVYRVIMSLHEDSSTWEVELAEPENDDVNDDIDDDINDDANDDSGDDVNDDINDDMNDDHLS